MRILDVFVWFFLAGNSIDLAVFTMIKKGARLDYIFFTLLTLFMFSIGTVTIIYSTPRSDMSITHLLIQPLLVTFCGSVTSFLIRKGLKKLKERTN